MNALMVAFVVVLALPLIAGSWRFAVAGLGAQAIIVFLMMITRDPAPHVETAALLFADLLLIRGIVTPLWLRRTILRAGDPGVFEIIAGDLLHWVVCLTLVVLGASFGQRVVTDDPWLAAHLGAAAAQILIGMVVVAQHRGPLGQVMGMLMIENGVLLFEASTGYHWPVALHLGLAAVFAVLLIAVRYYLKLLPTLERSDAPSEGNEAVL